MNRVEKAADVQPGKGWQRCRAAKLHLQQSLSAVLMAGSIIIEKPN